MKKKKILLLTSIVSIATFSAAAIIFSSQSKINTKADTEYNNYAIDFESGSCIPGDIYDNWASFTLSIEKGIGGKYDISTAEYCSYIDTNDNDNINFESSTSIFSVSGSNYCRFTIAFYLESRATFSCSNSYAVVHLNSSYYSSDRFAEGVSYLDGYKYYEYSFNYTSQSNLIELKKVHVEFSCAK